MNTIAWVPRPESKPRRDRRWPPALAVLLLIGLPVLLPHRFRLELVPAWMLPAIGGVFLVVILIADPDQATRHAKRVRTFAIGLTTVMVAAAVWFTAVLTGELVFGGPVTHSVHALLSTSALVWINNNIVFGLLYWELDSGGPAVRTQHAPRHPDFAFPQHMNPALAAPNWRPIFVDYLYLALTNATAFSPTDTMPLTTWAKLTMALQSLISITLLGLAIARAVNILA